MLRVLELQSRKAELHPSQAEGEPEVWGANLIEEMFYLAHTVTKKITELVREHLCELFKKFSSKVICNVAKGTSTESSSVQFQLWPGCAML